MFKIAELSAFCQQLVEAVSKLLDGRTINIMDLDGIIIASTEKNRIGTLHTGAKHVVTSGHALAITEELLPNYPGTKVGYNMPLTYHGIMFGVIGMFGIPEQVKDMAQLLKIYADKYFELEGNMEARLVDLSLRTKLFGLLAASNAETENVESVLQLLDVSFLFPVDIIRVSGWKEGNTEHLEDLVPRLTECGYIDPRHDFWSAEADSLTIIRSHRENAPDITASELLSAYRITIPLPAMDYEGISHAFDNALWISRHMDRRVVVLSCQKARLEYMMYRTAFDNSDIIDSYIASMKMQLPEKELFNCMQAVIAYYEENRSVTLASQALGIHKNTLQARVRKAMEAAGIDSYSPTEKCYVMQLVYIRLYGLKKVSGPSLNKLG